SAPESKSIAAFLFLIFLKKEKSETLKKALKKRDALLKPLRECLLERKPRLGDSPVPRLAPPTMGRGRETACRRPPTRGSLPGLDEPAPGRRVGLEEAQMP